MKTKPPEGVKPMTKEWTEWTRQRKKETYDLIPDGHIEADKRKRDYLLKYMIPHRSFLTNEMADKVKDTAGYFTDMWTIPLKDIPECPLLKYENPYDWSEISDIKGYVEKYGEEPKLNFQENIYAWFIKHEDPRKMYFHPASKKTPFHARSPQWFLTESRLHLVMHKLRLWNMGFWKYRAMLVKVSELPLKNLHIKDVKKEDIKEKNKISPDSAGSNYLFRVYDKKAKKFLCTDRHGNLKLAFTGRQGVWANRENTVRKYKKCIPNHLRSDDHVLVRFRVVLGKPVYLDKRENFVGVTEKVEGKRKAVRTDIDYARYIEHIYNFDVEYFDDEDEAYNNLE